MTLKVSGWRSCHSTSAVATTSVLKTPAALCSSCDACCRCKRLHECSSARTSKASRWRWMQMLTTADNATLGQAVNDEPLTRIPTPAHRTASCTARCTYFSETRASAGRFPRRTVMSSAAMRGVGSSSSFLSIYVCSGSLVLQMAHAAASGLACVRWVSQRSFRPK